MSKRLPAALCAQEKIHRRSECAPHACRFSRECTHPAKLSLDTCNVYTAITWHAFVGKKTLAFSPLLHNCVSSCYFGIWLVLLQVVIIEAG